VLSQDAGGFGGVDSIGLVLKTLRKRLELLSELLGKELFVEAGVHAGRFRRGWGLGLVDVVASF
jgi:hypothetical protein